MALQDQQDAMRAEQNELKNQEEVHELTQAELVYVAEDRDEGPSKIGSLLDHAT
jgi:hypothetical protein